MFTSWQRIVIGVGVACVIAGVVVLLTRPAPPGTSGDRQDAGAHRPASRGPRSAEPAGRPASAGAGQQQPGAGPGVPSANGTGEPQIGPRLPAGRDEALLEEVPYPSAGVDVEAELAAAAAADAAARRPRPPGVIPEYRAAGERAIRGVDVSGIARSIEQLQAGSLAARARAIRALKAATGLDFRYDPRATASKRGAALKRWERYVKALQDAVETKIPKLLEERTSRNRSRRGRAAGFLGEEAPHPAFVELLNAVLRNEQEPVYVRQRSILALSLIPHDGMVKELIWALGSEEDDVALSARCRLRVITGYTGRFSPDDRREAQRQYNLWWEQNKETFVYDRDASLRH